MTQKHYLKAVSNVTKLLILFVVVSVTFSSAVATASATTSSDIAISLDSSTNQVNPGETVEMTVEVTNVGDNTSPAPVVRLDSLPDGWDIVSWGGTDATYRDSTTEWLWVRIDPSESKSLSITLETSETSTEEDISVTFSDGDDRKESASTNVAVGTSEQTSDDEGSSGSDSPSNAAEFTRVDTQKIQDGALMEVSNAGLDEMISGEMSVESSAFSLEEISVTSNQIGYFSLEATLHENNPSDSAPNDVVLGYINATSTLTESDISSAAFTIHVDKKHLREQNLNQNSVSLYRYHDGDWSELDTEIVDENSNEIVIRSTTPGFSVFALAASKSTSEEVKSPDGASTGTPTDSTVNDDQTVTATEDSTPVETAETTSTQAPGFGIGIALLGLLSAFVLTLRGGNRRL